MKFFKKGVCNECGNKGKLNKNGFIYCNNKKCIKYGGIS